MFLDIRMVRWSKVSGFTMLLIEYPQFFFIYIPTVTSFWTEYLDLLMSIRGLKDFYRNPDQ